MRPLFLRSAGIFGTHYAHHPKTPKRSILGDLLVSLGWVKPTLAPADLAICEAEARRQALKAQLAAMSKYDSRRGEVERELRKNTFVVLSGGKAA